MSPERLLFRFVLAGGFCLSVAFLATAQDQSAAGKSLRPLLDAFAKEFVDITPGQGKFPAAFQFGPAGNQREVRFEKSFSIARYEVPQNLYEAVMGNNPSRWKGPRNSVELMTFAEAEQFCQKVTSAMRAAGLLRDSEVIRLPTEEEWEYCCRAGTSTRYSFGDKARAPEDKSPKATLLDKYGWHHGNAAGNDPPVGALAPNPWGLYDVHGYLWEFATPAAGAPADRVVVRGGSWKDEFPQLESASRQLKPADIKDDAIGFRCVKAAR